MIINENEKYINENKYINKLIKTTKTSIKQRLKKFIHFIPCQKVILEQQSQT